MTINRIHILLFFDIWWLLFLILNELQINTLHALDIVSCISLLLVPGLLTLFAFGVRGIDAVTGTLYALGISIIEIILVVLFGNTALPHFGIARPLAPSILISEISIMVAALIALSWLQLKSVTITPRRYLVSDSLRDTVLALLPLVLVLMSAAGATYLNNGGTGIITYWMLIAVALLSVVYLYYAPQFSYTVIPIGLFGLSLTLLFMTSLRGEFITGHDIQREFAVFQLAKTNGLWSIAVLRDAYNACLSITILPTILAGLSRISDPYVYKVLFQIIFTAVPVAVFLFVRRYLPVRYALAGALYFVAFPTFFGDMPFLNRQEIAFLFFVLMLLIIFDDRLSRRMREALFLFFSIGMVVSHYSTTYTIAALFLGVAIGYPIVFYAGRYLRDRGWLQQSGLAALHADHRARITIPLALSVCVFAFVWSSVLTDTSSNSLVRVIISTVQAMQGAAQQDARSSDVLYSLFSRHTVDPSRELQQFTSRTMQERQQERPGTYLSDETLARYPIIPATSTVLPLTPFGSWIESGGVDVPSLNAFVRSSSAKILQLLVLIGIVAILVRKRGLERLVETDVAFLMLGSLAMLVAIIVLPVLSVEYGLLRAFQQSLVLLALPVVFGSFVILERLGRVGRAFVLFAPVIFLLSTTGVITQSLGGYEPQLHLNNAGSYFDMYYLKADEIAATQWLIDIMRRDGVYAYQTNLLTGPTLFTDLTLDDGITIERSVFPSLVRAHSYTLVGPQIVRSHTASVLYDSDALIYTYPIGLLDDTKNLVYSNGDVRIYR